MCVTETKATRPSESDMISRPRADAMQRQLDAALRETEELREEVARMKAENARFADLVGQINDIATDPAFESDAMGWIAGYCWTLRTIVCGKCGGKGLARHVQGFMNTCDQCKGLGRHLP